MSSVEEDDERWGTTTGEIADALETTLPVAVLLPGTILGQRFRILEKLGAGGMGVVYRARDERLSRDVAIKVHARESGAQLLEREATAMAQLSHPNVVAVYEVGVHESAMFIAMELVEGGTARDWRARGQRSWREVVRLYLDAGKGLEALHRAGLIHRDFKPDNILVGSDGRVRIADLGLARATGHDGSVPLLAASAATGVAGTLAYMAPEQRAGGVVDARSDQFSFAASLSEALERLRPPRLVRRALARATAQDPAARWPTLTALLERLGRDRRPLQIGLALALLVGSATAFALYSSRAARCRGGSELFGRIWNPTIQSSIHDALAASHASYAESTWSSVARAVDAYRQRWIGIYTSACEATRVRGDQPQATLERTMACLEDRLEEVGSLTELMSRAGGVAVDTAVNATGRLSPLDRCADVEALTALVPPPADPGKRPQVADLRKRIAQAKAQYDAGKLPAAEKAYLELRPAAQALSYAPLTAELDSGLGQVYTRLGRDKEAEAILREGAYAAESARDDPLAALLWIDTLFIVGEQQARVAEAHEIERQAQASIDRLHGPHPDLQAYLYDTEASVLGREDKWKEAVVLGERALHLREQLFGADSPRIASSLSNLASEMDRVDPYSPETYKRTLPMHERALRMTVERLGPDHPEVADGWYNMAASQQWAGDIEGAYKSLQRALEIAETGLGREHESLGWYLLALAELDADANRLETGRREAERALAIREKTLGPEHPDTAEAHGMLAQILVWMGRSAEALPHAEQASAILQKGGPATSRLLDWMVLAGDAELRMGRRARAAERLQRALALSRTLQYPLPKLALAPLRWGLARVRDAEGQAAQARAIAQEAHDGFALDAIHHPHELREVGDWLAAH